MATANLLEFGAKPRATYSYSAKIANADQAMNKLRIEMYHYDIEKMAEHIGVSTACLYAVRGGRTKWPRPKTFFGLVEYLEFDMHLIKRT